MVSWVHPFLLFNGKKGNINTRTYPDMNEKETFRVLQVCQWKVVKLKDKISNSTLTDWEGQKFRNNEPFSTYLMIKEVGPSSMPPWGRVWFREDEESGLLTFYRANYDTSD